MPDLAQIVLPNNAILIKYKLQDETKGSLQVTPLMYLGMANLMVFPMGLFFLSIMLNQPVNHWLNIIVAILFFGFNHAGLLIFHSAYDKFLIVVSLGFNVLTIWYACRWVKPENILERGNS